MWLRVETGKWTSQDKTVFDFLWELSFYYSIFITRSITTSTLRTKYSGVQYYYSGSRVHLPRLTPNVTKWQLIFLESHIKRPCLKWNCVWKVAVKYLVLGHLLCDQDELTRLSKNKKNILTFQEQAIFLEVAFYSGVRVAWRMWRMCIYSISSLFPVVSDDTTTSQRDLSFLHSLQPRISYSSISGVAKKEARVELSFIPSSFKLFKGHRKWKILLGVHVLASVVSASQIFAEEKLATRMRVSKWTEVSSPTHPRRIHQSFCWSNLDTNFQSHLPVAVRRGIVSFANHE